jgi:hypothetical protein
MLSEGDAPSFVSFYFAAAYFWGGREVTGGQILPDSVHRHQDQRGRLKAIKALLEEIPGHASQHWPSGRVLTGWLPRSKTSDQWKAGSPQSASVPPNASLFAREIAS